MLPPPATPNYFPAALSPVRGRKQHHERRLRLFAARPDEGRSDLVSFSPMMFLSSHEETERDWDSAFSFSGNEGDFLVRRRSVSLAIRSRRSLSISSHVVVDPGRTDGRPGMVDGPSSRRKSNRGRGEML